MSNRNGAAIKAVRGAACLVALSAAACGGDDKASAQVDAASALADGEATGPGAADGASTAMESDAAVDGAAMATGPGTAFPCKSSGKDAFDTYGLAAFVLVNESIFSGVTGELADAGTAHLGTAFTQIGSGTLSSTMDDLPTFKGKLAAFLVYAYGGPASITYTDQKTYVGPQSMSAAHVGLGITSDQYDYFVSDVVVPALTGNGVTPDDVSSCFAPVVTGPAFKASIVGH